MDVAIRMEGITKRFPSSGVLANDHIDFQVRSGEIHCLLGENGAGKSTLMNILYGLYAQDEGSITIDGRKVAFSLPLDAIKAGIAMVHQHFMLIPVFTVLENLILGNEPCKGLFLDKHKAQEEITRLSETYSLGISLQAYIQDVSVGMQQRVEILKMLYRGAHIMVFDEPTAILTPQEVKDLFKTMRRLKEKGNTIIFITHKLQEVMEISDRVTVLRDGKNIATVETKHTDLRQLANLMVGREVLFSVHRPVVEIGGEVLRVEDLTVLNQRNMVAVDGMGFSVNEGEIIGFAGIDNNGQSELIESLTGLRAVQSGRICLSGEDLTHACPNTFLKKGIAHIPEDRLYRGIISTFSLCENLLLGHQDEKRFSRGMFLDYPAIKRWAKGVLESFDVRYANLDMEAGFLSGGNQQKVVVAREVLRNPKVLIAAQPTRGLDIGATEYMRKKLMDIKAGKKAILLFSLDLSELMGLSDRILVVFKGKIQGEFCARDGFDESSIGLLMAGGKPQ